MNEIIVVKSDSFDDLLELQSFPLKEAKILVSQSGTEDGEILSLIHIF